MNGSAQAVLWMLVTCTVGTVAIVAIIVFGGKMPSQPPSQEEIEVEDENW